jgi:hypothetical protein
VLKTELCARAELENIRFAAEMREFCAAYEDKVEEEQRDRLAFDTEDEDEDYDIAELLVAQDDWSEASDSSEEDDEAVDPGDETHTADMGMLNLEMLYD